MRSIARKLLALGAGAAVVGGALAAYARYIEPTRMNVERVTLDLPIGSDALDGMTIGFLTDLHVGPFTTLSRIERGIELLLNERPDLLLLGGDYHSESPRYLPGVAELLGRYRDAAPLGTIGVMGNHDYAVSGEQTYDVFAAVGIKLLRNEAIEVQYSEASLWIVGIDDTLLGTVDALSAFAPVPDGAPALALWHEPFHAEHAAELGAFAMLSGHTHGGQVLLPVIGPMAVPKHGKRFVIGKNQVNGMQVYTSRGQGMYRPPLRFNCPPEVTLVTLVAHQRTSGIASNGITR